MLDMNFFKNFNLIDKNKILVILISFLGLLPFIFGLIDLLVNEENLFFLINIPKYYGAIILTFLGAVYWGIVLNDNDVNHLSSTIKTYIICWSVIPSIFAITTLILTNDLSILILAFLFIFVQIIDEFMIKYLKFPFWYLMLRRLLTIIVVIILIFSYFLVIQVV